MSNRLNIIIAGGKTGGHLFPGIAVAQALERLHPHTDILFAGTDARFEVSTLERYGYVHKVLLAAPMKGGSLLTKAKGLVMLGLSLVQCLIILIGRRPDFVLGLGGFPSFAMVLGARILGIPTAIQEQNAFPGMANRILTRYAHKIFTAFESTRGMSGNPKTVCVGNPIREKGPRHDPDDQWLAAIRPDDFVLLITGGSQGASSINRAAATAVKLARGTEDLFIIHQTGNQDEDYVRETYQELGVRSRVRAFFHDLPGLQERADLVVCRAGAGTLSELALKGAPAVLIPFPYAADDHQTFNARDLVDKGAALMIPDKDLTGDALRRVVLDLKNHPDRRSKMAAAMKALAKPRAAGEIATYIIGVKEKGA